MSLLCVDDYGYAERETELNWAAEYADRALTAHREETELDHPDGCVTTDKLDNGAVCTEKIANGAVTTAKIAEKAVSSANLADEAVNENKIANGAVTKNKLSASVRLDIDSKLAAVPISAPGVVGGIKPLTDGSGKVNRSGLVIGEDGTAYISTKANGGISRDGAGQLYISNGGITRDMISKYAINADKLAEAAVGTPELANGAVTAAKLAEALAERLDCWSGINSVNPTNIDAHNDGIFPYLGNGKTDWDHDGILIQLNVEGFIYQILFTDTHCFMRVKDRPADGTGEWGAWTHLTLTDSAVTTTKLVDGAVITDKIGDGAVTNTKLGNRAVSTDKIEDNAVTADKLADNVKYDTYSTTPQRIGTWIDGTPIWRVVIQQSISEQERIDKSVSISLPVKNQMEPFIINDYMRLIYDNDCIVDDYKLPNFTAGCYDLPDWITTRTEYDKISGWIEFVTPESNIDQCYTGAWTELLNHKSSLNSVQSMYTSYSTNSNVSYNQYGPSQTACMQVTGGSSTAATGIKLDISDLFSDGDWIRAEFKIQVTGSPDTIQAFVTDNNQKMVLAKRGSGSMPIGEWINYTTDAAKVVSENGKIYFCVSNTCGYWYITDIVLYKLSA